MTAASSILELVDRIWPERVDFLDQVGAENFRVTLTDGSVHWLTPQGHAACGPLCGGGRNVNVRKPKTGAERRRQARLDVLALLTGPGQGGASRNAPRAASATPERNANETRKRS